MIPPCVWRNMRMGLQLPVGFSQGKATFGEKLQQRRVLLHTWCRLLLRSPLRASSRSRSYGNIAIQSSLALDPNPHSPTT